MPSEHETNEVAGASTEAKSEPAGRARAVRDALREGLVVAVATAFRAGNAIAAATEAPRESARSFLSAVSTGAGRIAGEAREMARRAAEEAAAGETPEAEEGGEGGGGAKPKKRRPKRGKRS